MLGPLLVAIPSSCPSATPWPFLFTPRLCPAPTYHPALTWITTHLSLAWGGPSSVLGGGQPGSCLSSLSPESGATAGPSPSPLARAVPWRTPPSAVAQPPHPKRTLSQTMSTLTHGHPHTCCAQAQGRVAKPREGVHVRGPALLRGC